jgi:hypothetical protein
MSELKKYRKKVDYIEAYRINPNAEKRQTLLMNQSGFHEKAYHADITTTTVSWVEPGDYVVKMPNGIYIAIRKEDFEAMYEPVEDGLPFPGEEIRKENKVIISPENLPESVVEESVVVSEEPVKKKRKSYKE